MRSTTLRCDVSFPPARRTARRAPRARKSRDAKAAEAERRLAQDKDGQAWTTIEILRQKLHAQYLRATAPARKPFLVRGLSWSENPKTFDVVECGSGFAIGVGQASEGPDRAKPKHTPILLYLVATPARVHIAARKAE